MNNNTLYKDSQLGMIPSDWKVKKIKDIRIVSKVLFPENCNLKHVQASGQ